MVLLVKNDVQENQVRVTCLVTTTQDKHVKTYKSFGIVGEVQVWMLSIDTQEVKKYFSFTKFESECLLSYLKCEQYDMESTSREFNTMKGNRNAYV